MYELHPPAAGGDFSYLRAAAAGPFIVYKNTGGSSQSRTILDGFWSFLLLSEQTEGGEKGRS